MFLTEEMKVVNHKEVTSNTLINKEYNEEGTASYDILNYPRQTQNNSNNNNIKNKKENYNKDKINEIKKNAEKINQKEKYKLSGLSSEMLKFYFEVDEFRTETLIKRINEKINGNLKKSTVDEINEKRKLFGVKLDI